MNGLTRRWEGPPPTNPRLGLIERILEGRGLANPDDREHFLVPKLSDMADPGELAGVGDAATCLADAVEAGRRVMIYGDYDADGITASAVLHHVIAAASGREGPGIYIPHRVDEGYGIHSEAVRQLASDGVECIVSVDCGITGVEAAEVARDVGIELIITDHHQPLSDGSLPDCAAIVHPGLEGPPATPLAGVGVAFKLAWALATQVSGGERATPKLRDRLLTMLPLVAIGTIADLVPLIGDNRPLVYWGLNGLRKTAIPGLKALLAASGFADATAISAGDVGFRIAPLLNAAGRLTHASEAVDLLTHLDGDLARAAAEDLSRLNKKRQGVQEAIVTGAMEAAEEAGMIGGDRRIIILSDPNWHRGVVGTAASRVQERHHRPVILLAEDEEGGLHGSARSINGYSILEGLTCCEAHLDSWGGHPMAAGVSLRKDALEDFIASMTEHANAGIDESMLIGRVKIDAMSDLRELSGENVTALDRMQPTGVGNPQPVVIIRGVAVQKIGAMGGGGKHLQLRVRERGGNRTLRCVWWNQGERAGEFPSGTVIDLVGKPAMSSWSGNPELTVLDVALPGG
jgi:single-stranded-DNA-specific exonuclease